MASVDWMKFKAGGMRKLAGHYQQELREKLNHSNSHIDKEKTMNNFSIGAKDFYEACNRINARVQDVDKEHPPKRIKKDRVTACGLEVVCPPEIEAMGMDAVAEYFRKTHEAFEDYFGKENVGGSFVHLDEKHSYIDAKTKQPRESLFHMTTFLAAYVDEDIKTKKGMEHITGINGKTFSSRNHIKASNRIMEDICQEYGIEWHTGEGKNHETIETLKAKSAQAEREILEAKKADLEKEISALSQESMKIEEQLKDGKDVLHSVKERENLTILDRLRLFVDDFDIQPAWKKVFNKLIDLFEEHDREQARKIILWEPKKNKGKDIEIER